MRRAERETEILVRSQFDPARYRLPWTNTADNLSRAQLRWGLFERSYSLTLFSKAFFGGIYQRMVFMVDDAGRPGGLCVGMARAALARSLDEPPVAADPVDEVVILHGRQASDRAVLTTLLAMLRPSPRRAYRHFRDDVLRQGWSDRCFDVGVPRLWRRDIACAWRTEWHTVVPYALRQSEPARAEVFVYDPNDPLDGAAEPRRIVFDLNADTYAYDGIAGLDTHRTTVVAMRQTAYRHAGTAILASLANLALYPGSVHHIGRWLGAVAGVAGLLAICGRAIRGERSAAGTRSRRASIPR